MEATRCRQPAPLGLEHLLSPIGVPEFLSENWDRSPLAITRSSPSHYEGLLTRTELDRLVSASVVDERDARIVKDGVADPSVALFDDAGRANIAGLYGAYDQGYTVVINNVHKRRAEVGILCRNIEESLGHPAGANAYLTPAGARGLRPHFDDHDVFVLQLEGVKRWRIYGSPLPLPLREQHRDIAPAALGAPLQVLELQPGDLLYMPRGVVHEAEAHEESSLHLTIGIPVYTLAAVLAQTFAVLASEDVEFRRALEPGAFEDAHTAQRMKERLHGLLERVPALADFDRALAELQSHFVEQMDPLPDGSIGNVDAARDIGVNTVVRKRVGSRCAVTASNGTARILFPGNSLEGPSTIEPALRFISEREAFAVRGLRGDLTNESKIVLVQRLISAGLLVVIE